jgi:hypothetical protein
VKCVYKGLPRFVLGLHLQHVARIALAGVSFLRIGKLYVVSRGANNLFMHVTEGKQINDRIRFYIRI